MVLVLRLRTSRGTKRLLFSNDKATIGDLMLQVWDLTGIKPTQQSIVFNDIVSRRRSDVTQKDQKESLSSVPLRTGDMLLLVENEKIRAKAEPKKEEPKETTSSSSKEKAKKGPHMTIKAFKKASGNPVIPDYESFFQASSKQRSVNSYAPNIHWKLQRYRHLDLYAFADPSCLKKFYRNSFPELKQNLSRIGILFGRYVEDINPLADQNLYDDLNREKKWDYDANGVRADVFAIYEPPQQPVKNGARFLTDPRQEIVQGMAEAMGLEPVGMIICKKKAKANPKGFQTYLTGKELLLLAKLQSVFSDENNFSRFGCVVLEHSDMIEPVGLAASDTCMALERAELLDTVKGAPYKLRTKSYFYEIHTASEKLSTGDPFPMDFLTVKIIATQSRGTKKLFLHHDFPVQGGMKELKNYMQRYSNEGFAKKFSDFNLLINLPKMMGDKQTETCVEIAKCIGFHEEFPPKVSNELDTFFIKNQLF